jgi:replicative DNA helicase
VAGYSGDGKTSFCVNWAWQAAVQQGLNVYFATTETLRPQVRRKLISRHSVTPHFELPEGINSAELKAGSLPDHLEAKLQDVVADLTRNPAYGKLYLAQVPRGATVQTLESRLLRVLHQWRPDFVIVDYLALFQTDRKRQSQREELGDLIKEAKQVATTFADGTGVPVVTPWQVNRTSRDEAERVGYYTSKALSDTAEATNSADIIPSFLAPLEAEGRSKEIKGQLMKNRDGETVSGVPIMVDYATCTFTEKQASTMSAYLDDAL